MRIIAGTAKGRRLRAPRGGDTRPMTDRVREAVFSSLGDRIRGADVVDLFAGSGSLGLEALSRGAATATFVESGRQVVIALRGNVEAVGLGGTVIERSVEHYLGSATTTFDLVFVDPPFAMTRAIVMEVLTAVSRLLRPDGTVVLHRRHGDEPPTATGLELEQQRRYGDSEVFRYREAVGDNSAVSREL